MNIVINRFLKTFLIICMVLVSIILNASFQAWAGEVVVTVETPDDKYLTFDDIYKTRIPPNGWENTMWNDPGGWITIDVTDNGLPPNSPSIDATIAIQSIINSSSGNRILYFPQGTYYFQTPLTINVGNIRFMGEGVNYTIFKISGMSSQNVQITFSGEVSGSPISVVGSPAPGDNIIIVSDASTLNVGDIIQLYAEYPPLENRGLAWGDCRIYGQFLKIIDKNGETLMLDMKIGLPYDSSYKPKVQKYNMLSNIGFEKIKIIRDNQTDDEKKAMFIFVMYIIVL